MKCAFIADTILLKKNNNYYGITLTYDFLSKRYLKYTDELVIISREKNIELEKGNVEGYKITNGKNIIVSPIEDYKSIPDAIIKKKKIYNEFENRLSQCNAAIIRLPNVLGLMACEICEKLNIPYIIEMLACPFDGYYNHSNINGKIIAPFMYFLNKRAIRRSKETIYVTKEFLQKRYPTKGNSYSCSDVELERFNDTVLDKKIEKYKVMDLKHISLATTANIEMKYKGHIYVFKAIKKLKKDGIYPTYYLIGNGNKNRLEKAAIKLGIKDNIVFVGSLKHEDVFKKLDNIDLYVQPSLQEGLPRALVEAMSRACSCIGSNAGGIPELLESKSVFERKKYRKLYKIIKSLTIDDYVKSAKYNFSISMNYNKDVLEAKRDIIYNSFFKNI